MDIREKLVELLTNSPQLDVLDWTTGWEEAANYLIAHGVMVQEWISVKDRLPEEDYTFVLVLVETWKRTVGVALYAEHGFYNPLAADVQMNVTHWMPLPEPPKGE